MSVTTEVIVMWTAVTLYAVGSVLYAVGVVFRRDGLLRAALYVSLAGLVPHAVAIAGRWIRVQHGPYLGFYEVVSSYAFASVLVLGLVAWRYRALRVAGVALMPIAFLMLAASMFTPKAELEITSRLASWWLTIHVAFAKLTYASFIAAFAIALIYLVRARAKGGFGEMLAKLPSQEILDELAYRFISIGFIFLTVMIVAGAIWANEAWGRYWGWDPIETWSLVSWIVYAVVLHLRLTMGWRGRKAAWAAVAALPVVVFALIGVPIVYQSIHGAYLTGIGEY